MKTAIIIGAGPAGLTAAYELLTKTDIQPIIIETDSQPGGLAKTINYKGNKIDIGGHRFFSKSERVIDWWLQFLPLDPDFTEDKIHLHYQNKDKDYNLKNRNRSADDKIMLVRKRKSRIFYQNKFFDYPLRLNMQTIRNLGFMKVFRMGLSYLYAKVFPERDEKNLEQFFKNRFGNELYQTFFKDYTEKVWGVPCNNIPAAWGEQRVKNLDISKVIGHALKSFFSRKNKTITQEGTTTSLIEQFLYPKYGPGQMWETVAEEITQRGGIIHYNSVVTALYGDGKDKILSADVKFQNADEIINLKADYFLSGMPIKTLVENTHDITIPPSVRHTASGLEYRDFLIAGILAKDLLLRDKNNERVTDNWIYVQDKNVKAGRLQLFHNWSPYLVADPNDSWIGAEYFCNETDDLWKADDKKIKDMVLKEMQAIGILNPEQVKDMIIIRVKKAYPSYYGAYKNFDVIREYADTVQNLFLIGRNGMHRYNNSDHSMLTAMTAVENIIAGRTDKTNIWEINTEEEYHEEK